MTTLGQLSPTELGQRLAGNGLRLQTGPVGFCIRSEVPAVVNGVASLYGAYPVLDDREFTDFQISVNRAKGLRRWVRPQLHFGMDGRRPFAPLPGDQGLPMLEWGMNWCVSGLYPQFLILHAAVLERNGQALVLPAPSGSGKSTLCAALLFHGWRLLSDELALIRLDDSRLVPMPRPVSLKNASIGVIKQLVPGRVAFASVVNDTIKGTVGHFAAPAESVQRCDEMARPGWVVFPRYLPDTPATFNPLGRGATLLRLIDNAFNFNVQGEQGFSALAGLVEGSWCAEFHYGNLPEAIAVFERLAQAGSATTT